MAKRKHDIKIEAYVLKRARVYWVAIVTRIGRYHQSSTVHSKWPTRSQAQFVASSINKGLQEQPL